jgi:hypothetical protein
MLVAVTDHAAERFRQRVQRHGDAKTEIASAASGQPATRSSHARVGAPLPGSNAERAGPENAELANEVDQTPPG